MSRNNHPFQVLVTADDASLLAAGNAVEDLAVGQIGLFNADTNLSIDGTSAVRNFYLAVGVDTLGGSTLNSINESAGQKIQTKNVTNYKKNVYNAALPQILDFVDYSASCDEDYAIKLEFKNALLRQRLGFVGFSHTYALRSGVCEGCEECPSGDCVEVTEALVNAINLDTYDLVTAYAIAPNAGTLLVTVEPTASGIGVLTFNGTDIDVGILDADTKAEVATKIAAAIDADSALDGYTVAVDGTTGEQVNITKNTNGGVDAVISWAAGTATAVALTIVQPTAVVVTDFDTWKAANVDACLGVRMITDPIAVNTFCNIPTKFYKPLQTSIFGSGADGFVANGTFIKTQDVIMEEGTGRYVQQLEYVAGGWNGKPGPYKASPSTGLAREGFVYHALSTVNYDLIALGYEQYSGGGGNEGMSEIETILAIPTDDSTTSAALLTALDALLDDYGHTTQS